MDTLLYEKSERIATITLNRPNVQNAINSRMNDELYEVWTDFAKDDQADVAILTGAGATAFCAGADLKEYIPRWLDRDVRMVRENVEQGLGGITRGLHKIRKPIVAAVNGWALAGGFELALACDVRIVAENARFGSFEIHRGFHHGDGGIVRLVASVGVARTLDIVLSGREILPEEALRIGIAQQVVPQGQALTAARDYAKMLLSKSQVALRSAKETISEVIGRSLDDALKVEAIYGYSSGDIRHVRRLLEEFNARSKNKGDD